MTGECSVDGCGNTVKAKGLCALHYRRKRKGLDLLAPPVPQTTKGEPLAYLMRTLEIDTDFCVPWPYGCTKGYARMTFEGQMLGAYRVACMLKHGPPPTPEHEAAHSCGNGTFGCINWKHLRWATVTENAADKAEHGTLPLGSRHGMSKLDEAQVREIKKSLANGERSVRIAERFDVTPENISAIKRGLTWAWLKEDA